MTRSKRERFTFSLFEEPGVNESYFSGLASQKHQWFPVEGRDLPGRIWLRLSLDPEGRLVCTGLIVGDLEKGPQLSTRALRGIELAKIIDDLLHQLRDAPDYSPLRQSIGQHYLDQLFAQPTRRKKPPKLRPGPKGYDRQHFEQVAFEYQRALLDSPQAPIKALAERMGASEATVHRWLRKARDMGIPRMVLTDLKRERPEAIYMDPQEVKKRQEQRRRKK